MEECFDEGYEPRIGAEEEHVVWLSSLETRRERLTQAAKRIAELTPINIPPDGSAEE